MEARPLGAPSLVTVEGQGSWRFPSFGTSLSVEAARGAEARGISSDVEKSGAGDPGILIFWGLLINVVDSVMFCGCVSGSGGRWDFGV